MTDDARDARRALVQRYLLGTLDEASAAELRAEIIADEAVFDEIREVELDLLDDLARGSLDAETRALVESRLLPIESNRDAWAVAQALARVRADASGGSRASRTGDPRAFQPGASSSSVASARPGASPSPGASPLAGPSSWWRRGGFLAAAATVIAVAGLAFMLSRATSGPDVRGPADSGGARPGAPPTPPPDQVAGGTKPNVTPPSSPSTPPPAGSPSSPAAPPSADGSVVALYLPAGVLRGARPSVRILSATRTVRIELEIVPPPAAFASPSSPASASAAHVAIVLVDASGREVWASPGVPVTRDDGQAIAAVDVPAASLPAGALEAVISTGKTPSAPARRPFLVLRD